MLNEDTWRPCNTERMLLQEISEFNKNSKKKITFDYSLIGLLVIDGLTIHFNNKDTKITKSNRRFCIKYHYAKGFFRKLIDLFKKEESYYEIYTEQGGFLK